MPRLRDIESFKDSLKTLGNEPEALELWGETYQDIQPPPPKPVPAEASKPEAAPEDAALQQLLQEPSGPGDDNNAELIDSPTQGNDFSDFLGTLDLDSLPEAEAPSQDTSDTLDLSQDFELPDLDMPVGSDEPESAATAEQLDEPAELDALEDFDSLLPADDMMNASANADSSESKLDEPEDFDISSMLTGGLADELSSETDVLGDTPPGDTLLDSFMPEDLQAEDAQAASSMPEDFSIPDFDIDPSSSEPLEPQALDDAGEAGSMGTDLSAAADSELPSMDIDAFDSFDLSGEAAASDTGALVPDLDAAAFSGGLQNDLDGQLASLDSDAPVGADMFSLDAGWGGDFSIPGFDSPKAGKAAPQPAASSFKSRIDSASDRAQSGKVRAVELSDAQVDALQDTLLSYPLNLRLCVEDAIANSKGSEAQQAELIWMLVDGASAKDAAKHTGKILKRYIAVPAGFEKKTGAALEAEKGTLAYLFRHSILPMLQALVLAGAALGALYFLGYNFVYKPIKANSTYAQGYRQITSDKYQEADDLFLSADRIWPMKRWYYRYAQGLVDKAQYPRAETMYERLLSRWPRETRAALDYARMESQTLYAFENAEKILKRWVLERDYFNKDALVLMADNYLAWADMEEQKRIPPAKEALAALYENARYYLATLMDKHGRTDPFMERMLIYFMRVEQSLGLDKLKDIEPIAQYFLATPRSKFSSSTLAELGEYLMKRDRTDQVGTILIAAVDRDGSVPEAHVAMAKWNRRTGFPDDERKALLYAVRFFREADQRSGLVTRRLRSYLSTLIRLSEVYIGSGESLDAEEALSDAIARYERGLEELRFNREAEFGKAYSLLAGIYYLERMDFDGALALYAKAEQSGYSTPETDYRRGYMWYRNQSSDGSAALAFFYRAGLDRDPSPWLSFATGNALYARGDFFAAQAYFSMLADRMQFELNTISIPSPQAKPSHREIVEILIMARNNLGACLYRSAERLGDARRRSEAMVQFTESARLFDSLSRDQRTMIRSDSKNLGFLNLDYVLHPMRGIDIATYRELPVDMKYPAYAVLP